MSPRPVDFNATVNARIVCSLGGVDVSSGMTLVALWRPVAPVSYQALLSVEQASGGALVGLLLTNGNAVYWEINGTGNRTSAAVVATDVWQIIAVTKASGSSAPRTHIYNFATSAWTRQDHAAVGDTLLATQAQVSMGVFDAGTTHFADGYCAAWAIYGDPLSDVQLDVFPSNYDAWLAASPQAMWVANGSTAMTDETAGGANETSRGSGVTDAGAIQASPLRWVVSDESSFRHGRSPLVWRS